MKKIFSLILLITLISFAVAECETTIDKIDRFDATYSILETGEAEVTLVIVANFEETCLIERYKQDLNLGDNEEITIQIPYQDFVCPKEFVLDNVKAEFGNFPNGLNCSASFTNDKNHIRMDFTGISSPLGDKNKDNIIVSLGNSNFTKNLTTDSSLTIFIPSNAEYLNHSPKNGSKLVNKLYFAPFPKEEVKFEYYLPQAKTQENELSTFLPAILVGIAGLAILITIIGIMFLKQPKQTVVVPKETKNEEKDLLEQGKKLKMKMKSLEQAYLKGTIDQSTYKRLMEQYQYQLNDIRVELKQKNS